MVKNRTDYPPDAVEAARSVLVELVHILGEYRDDMVIVGGWVPPLLMPDSTGHVGSTDVDIALNHMAENDEVYARISASLLTNGYVQHESQPFIWFREVSLGGGVVTVEIDFLAGEYGGTGKHHRTQRVQDLKPRKARGADLLFSETREREIEGRLPSGALDTVSVKVAGVVSYLVMKSSALETRIKDKDAYDIWFTLANYPGGIPAVVEEFTPFADHGLVRETVSVLEGKFTSPEHFGPTSVAVFLEHDGDAAVLTKRDAFERVQALLDGLGALRD
ncbi:MAG: hypothetical protein Q8K99_02565 [Actinomycetota bacterium]|nr:hypothetical protein [Actinomycetota bacterium]